MPCQGYAGDEEKKLNGEFEENGKWREREKKWSENENNQKWEKETR